MSDPVTDAEKDRAARTLAAAGNGEYLVSTACPSCGIRFAMLGRPVLRAVPGCLSGSQLKFAARSGWELRCTNCGHECQGELK